MFLIVGFRSYTKTCIIEHHNKRPQQICKGHTINIIAAIQLNS